MLVVVRRAVLILGCRVAVARAQAAFPLAPWPCGEGRANSTAACAALAIDERTGARELAVEVALEAEPKSGTTWMAAILAEVVRHGCAAVAGCVHERASPPGAQQSLPMSPQMSLRHVVGAPGGAGGAAMEDVIATLDVP